MKVLFSKPSADSSPEGRGQERYRRAAWTTLVMIMARMSNILTGLITVPITLSYLGEDLYGVWMALTGFVGFLSFYDFGIGTGLRNMLIKCAARDDDGMARTLIFNAMFALTILSSVMILSVLTLFPHIPWEELIKCKNLSSIPQILPTAQTVVILFALGLPITQLQNIANAYQRGYWGYLCILAGRILGFLFVVWCVHAGQPMWLLAGGYVGAPFLVTLIGWAVFLMASPSLRPWRVGLDTMLMKQLFGIGFYVLIHHISFALINTSGLLLIANTIDAASGVPYSVTQQMVNVSNVIPMALMVGISPAVGEAWHRSELPWIKKMLKRAEWTTFLFVVPPLAGLLVAGQDLVLWWTKSPAAVPSLALLTSCILLSGTFVFGSIYSNCLIAMNYVRFIALTKFVFGLLVLGGGYVAGALFDSTTLIVLSQFLFGALFPSLLFYLKIKRLIRGAELKSSGMDIHSGVAAEPCAQQG